MLRRTFQHIPGVGPWRERDLWARGFTGWDEFPAPGGEIAISAAQDDLARQHIAEMRELLEARDLAELARRIPPREHWRLYPPFEEEAVFFDIEADGDGELTVVGLFHRDGVQTFIRGRNLEALPAALGRWPFWITFNGSVHDVPVLSEAFGKELPTPAVHLDLRFLCKRQRLPGGLKGIEDQLGISRPPHLRGVTGMEAIRLWRLHQETKSIEPLRFLVEYNLYDAINLRSLIDATYNRAAEYLACEVPRRPIFDRGEVLYDVSRLLLSLE
jgi:uncharacterized protein YprB with RNaseH-like and TPR domain